MKTENWATVNNNYPLHISVETLYCRSISWKTAQQIVAYEDICWKAGDQRVLWKGMSGNDTKYGDSCQTRRAPFWSLSMLASLTRHFLLWFWNMFNENRKLKKWRKKWEEKRWMLHSVNASRRYWWTHELTNCRCSRIGLKKKVTEKNAMLSDAQGIFWPGVLDRWVQHFISTTVVGDPSYGHRCYPLFTLTELFRSVFE